MNWASRWRTLHLDRWKKLAKHARRTCVICANELCRMNYLITANFPINLANRSRQARAESSFVVAPIHFSGRPRQLICFRFSWLRLAFFLFPRNVFVWNTTKGCCEMFFLSEKEKFIFIYWNIKGRGKTSFSLDARLARLRVGRKGKVEWMCKNFSSSQACHISAACETSREITKFSFHCRSSLTLIDFFNFLCFSHSWFCNKCCAICC